MRIYTRAVLIIATIAALATVVPVAAQDGGPSPCEGESVSGTVVAVDEGTGKLTFVGRESTQGETPRGFVIDPTGTFLLAANQNTDNIVTFRVDEATGKLAPTGHDRDQGGLASPAPEHRSGDHQPGQNALDVAREVALSHIVDPQGRFGPNRGSYDPKIESGGLHSQAGLNAHCAHIAQPTGKRRVSRDLLIGRQHPRATGLLFHLLAGLRGPMGGIFNLLRYCRLTGIPQSSGR